MNVLTMLITFLVCVPGTKGRYYMDEAPPSSMKAVCKKCGFEVSGNDASEVEAKFRPHFETYGHEFYLVD